MLLSFVFTMNVVAQSVTDLLKYSDNTIMGTARYMGMAGSFGALGGDPTAIIDNPAALGVYRSSEMSISLNPTITQTSTLSSNTLSKERSFYFNFSNAAFVLAIPTYKDKGLVSANFSFTYNRLKDFHRVTGYRDYSNSSSLASTMARLTDGLPPYVVEDLDNLDLPYLSHLAYNNYLINPGVGKDSTMWTPHSATNTASAYYGIERGRVEEYNFAYGMNFSHRVYVGLSVGVQSLFYSMSTENSERYNDTQNMTLHNAFQASGVGVNFGLGLIVRASSFLRLAASLHTPTYYAMNEVFTGKISSENLNPNSSDYYYQTPTSSSTYEYSAPLKFMASAAFVIGKRALINVEYQLADYKNTMNFGEDNWSRDYLFVSSSGYSIENAEIKKYAKISHTAKLGLEYRIASQYSFRAGFAYVSPSTSENVVKTILNNTTRTDMDYYYDKGSYYGSIGFGYRYNGFGVDIAYLYRNKVDGFATYQQDAELIDEGRFGVPSDAIVKERNMTNIHTHKHNIALTVSYKF